MLVDYVQEIVIGFWDVLSEMAPYLLFGFLVAGILSVMISTRLVERHLGGRGIWPIFKASILGVPLPLCSCGVIPVAASLRRNGASRGATASFLLSTPQTGIDSVMVTLSLLGPVFAVFRPLAALVTGLVGGQLVESLGEKDEHHSHLPVIETVSTGDTPESNRISRALKYGFISLPQDIGRGLLIGLIVAGLITAMIPDDFFMGLLGAGIGSMLVMILVGIPIYICATASVPVAAALIIKGISPGAALVFLVAGPATNIAAITTLWNVLGRRSTLIYLGTVALAALGSGLALDSIISGFSGSHFYTEHSMFPDWVGTTSSILLLGILLNAVVQPYILRRRRSLDATSRPSEILKINGMTCNHCAANVEKALSSCDGVESVDVDLIGKSATVYGDNLNLSTLRHAVVEAGFRVV